jgi:hypothetical protein
MVQCQLTDDQLTDDHLTDDHLTDDHLTDLFVSMQIDRPGRLTDSTKIQHNWPID